MRRWATWWALDGPDDTHYLRAFDTKAKLNKDVLDVLSTVDLWHLGNRIPSVCALTGDGKAMLLANYHKGKCWVGSLVHMPLTSLDNGYTAGLSRLIQLQTDTQCVGVHHVPHSEACDAGSPKTTIAHRVFKMPFERLISVFRRNTVKNVQTPKATRKMCAVTTCPMYPRGHTPLQFTPTIP